MKTLLVFVAYTLSLIGGAGFTIKQVTEKYSVYFIEKTSPKANAVREIMRPKANRK